MNTAIDDRTLNQKFDCLLAFTREAMQRDQVPGVLIGLIAGGEQFVAGLGVTSAPNPLPVTPETLFQIGSTTKTVTATALLRLAEQGHLALDDQVRAFLPDFQVADETAAAAVTLRHLLTHTPGWLGDFFPECGSGDDALARYITAMRSLPQRTPLGAFYAYNNAALVVAGRVIEAVTRQTYEAAVRSLVLEPLEMNNSFFFPQEVMLHRFAVGHWLEEGQAVVASPWAILRAGNPAGGLISDAWDQLRYMQFHMAGVGTVSGGKRVLEAASLRLMQTPAVPIGDGNHVGLTWTIEEIDGVKILSHGGTTNGQESDFWFAPEHGVGLTVLTNLDRGDRVHRALRDWALEHYLGVRRKLPGTRLLAEDELKPYAAVFLTSAGGELRVLPHAGGLLLQHTQAPGLQGTPSGEPLPPMRARLYAPDRFLVLDEPFAEAHGEFLRAPGGAIEWLRLGGRILPRKPNA